jgi:hypothetical protein
VKIINFTHRIIYYSFLLIALFFIVNNCAKVGTITGGPKDDDPPVMLGSIPIINSTNFKEKKIVIFFNEFLQLKDINQQFNISPPLKKKPLIWLKGKSVVIQYSDTLKENTTYTLSFGNSITDNNENNILQNFEFTFSTGNFIDSLCIQGLVLDAFTLKPNADQIIMMLYSNLADSAPIKDAPLYTGRTNKEGYFSINNIRQGIYKLYALKDKNFNFRYDAVSEAIGFIDTAIILDTSMKSKLVYKKITLSPDTMKKDSLHKVSKADSLLLKKRERNSIAIEMFTFSEKEERLYIKDFARKENKKLSIIFNRSLIIDSLDLKLIYFRHSNWYQIEKTPKKDTIYAWITDTSLINIDTLKVSIGYLGTTKHNDTVWMNDTVSFRYIKGEKKFKKKDEKIVEKMKIYCWNSGGDLDLNAELIIEAQFPVSKINPSYFQITQKVDSIEFPRRVSIISDEKYSRRFRVHYAWEEKSQYKLTILPGAFEDIYSLGNDTTIFNFETKKLEYYGKLTIRLSGVNTIVIVQFLDNEKVAYQQYVNHDGPVVFNYLVPKKYVLKIIFDTNNDKEWTSGQLLKKIQPEKVVFYNNGKEINVRSNWDSEIMWNLQ